jgi:hypothetical protein
MLFKGLIDAIEVVMLVGLGVKINEKWPKLGSTIAFVFNAAEAVAKWVYGLFKSANPAPPAA